MLSEDRNWIDEPATDAVTERNPRATASGHPESTVADERRLAEPPHPDHTENVDPSLSAPRPLSVPIESHPPSLHSETLTATAAPPAGVPAVVLGSYRPVRKL